MTNTKDPLLQPFRLKHLTLKNRIMSTSHAISYGEKGHPTERYQLYHEEKAKGGIALTMFGGASNVSPDSPDVFGQLYVGDDSVIPRFQEFSERIHRHGCAIMCQITHLGRRGDSFTGDWLPIVAPSRVREPLHRSFPKEMDEADIERIVGALADAAGRCKEGGLDGIEVIAGGHLVGQFLSPLTNKRTDKFGGSMENRCRFGLMVYEAIRKRVGDDFAVGMRMPINEETSDALSFDDCLAIARIFEESGFLDFFNLIFGRMDTVLTLAEKNMPGMASPIAPFLDRIGAFRREVGLPVFHAARITDVATARHAIRDGLLDMVAMTRAHIADPHIVEKIARGEEDRIRPCIGAMYCNSPKRTCLYNAAIGREAVLPHTIAPSPTPGRKVVIVGGGPGGMEAARVSAARGHDVVLFEASDRLGGQINIAARADWRRDLMGIVDWLAAELAHHGVDVRLNTFAEEADILAESPHLVVVATGGVPDLDWIDGWEHCVSTWDVLSGAVAVGADVLVYDGTGQHAAVSCAEELAAKGRQVRLVTPDTTLAMDLPYGDRVIFQKRFYEKEIPVIVDLQLTRVVGDGNRLIAEFTNTLTGKPERFPADQIVVEHGTVPVDDLYHALRGASTNGGVTDIDTLLAGRPQPADRNADGTFQLHRVGDAVSCRNIHSAILDSLRVCVTF
jgi:2,4-dienoyl-CoA reductase-like NADH-dependent reductase (Old Yellow Enzyme family)